MNINIELKKNFINAYNKMQNDYGEEMAKINGFSAGQLSYTDFIDNFIDSDTVADASVDGNANVGQKDIVTLINEMPKPHQKLLAFNKIHLKQQMIGCVMSGMDTCICTMQIPRLLFTIVLLMI